MKKFLLSMMLCLPVILAAQNGVTVSGLAIDAGTVTFNISWNKDNVPAVWSDTVWVFVDYNVSGKMERLPLSAGATLTTTSAPGFGRVEYVANNNKGVWVVGNARTSGSFSAVVQLLTAAADVAGACVYGSNYPPVGNYTSATTIAFTGTQPYDVVLKGNGGATTMTLVNSGTYTLPAGYTLQSFSDKTGAPGKFNCTLPAIYTLSGSDVCLNSTVTLTLSGSQGGWQYRLYKGGAAIGSVVNGTGSALIFSEAAAATGTFNYTVQTVDPIGAHCEMPVSNVQSITVTALPTNLTLTASPTSICNGQSSTLTASATSGASYSRDNSSWQTTTAFNVTPTSNTSYTLYVKTSAGCSASKTNAAAVTNASPVISTHPVATSVCPGGMVTLSVTASPVTAYRWRKNGTNTTEGSNYTNAAYTTAALTSGATYSVVVANGSCSVTSNNAVVSMMTGVTAPGATVNFTAFNPCSNAATGATWTLQDTRESGNNQNYKVKKMADGHIWMVQDMKFGNLCGTTFNGSSATDQTGKVSSIGTYYGDCTAATSTATPANRGYLYDWAAAIQKSGAYSGSSSDVGCSGTASGISGTVPGACRGICPEGWHIPTGGSSGEFQVLHTIGNCSTSNDDCWNAASAWEGVLGGFCFSNGSLANQGYNYNYWSSTYINTSNAYCLSFISSSVNPGTNDPNKNLGISVRCIRNY